MELIDLLTLCRKADIKKCHVVIHFVRTGKTKTFIIETLHLYDLLNEYSVDSCLVVRYKFDLSKNLPFIECVC